MKDLSTKAPEIATQVSEIQPDSVDDNLSEDDEVIEDPITDQPFSKADLLKVWNNYANQFEKSDARLYNTLTVDNIDLKNETEVHLGLFNSLQVDNFNNVKVKLLKHLRQALKNSNIDITVYLVEQADIPKPLSISQKFEAMAEKNMKLRELKDRLNLEFE